jgi:hypothetical protein
MSSIQYAVREVKANESMYIVAKSVERLYFGPYFRRAKIARLAKTRFLDHPIHSLYSSYNVKLQRDVRKREFLGSTDSHEWFTTTNTAQDLLSITLDELLWLLVLRQDSSILSTQH